MVHGPSQAWSVCEGELGGCGLGAETGFLCLSFKMFTMFTL